MVLPSHRFFLRFRKEFAMFIELHLLQNFAPSNLNRDDTNAPKDCEFGGYRRARISSQCIKRAIRRQFQRDLLLPAESLAHRTKRLVDELTKRLVDAGHEKEQAPVVAATAVKGAGLGVGEDGKTEYLLFLGEREIQAIASLLNEHWDEFARAAAAGQAGDGAEQGKKKTGKEKKKEAKGAIPAEVKKKLDQALDGGRAADLALFGRMLADLPGKNVDGACQVAHAFSTNKASMEMDYYTAVDDLKPDDTPGADMIGTVEFNSSCFYRYANIDVGQLRINLQGDEELVGKTIEAFLRTAVTAIPTGKQHSMAAQNVPSLIFAVVRNRGLWSLANAFVQPIRPGRDKSLVQNSVEALDGYWGKLVEVFSDRGILTSPVCLVDVADLNYLKKSKVATLEEFVARVMEVVEGDSQQEAKP
jgi:CRISPR system Cascade subunit CasC